MFHFSPKPRPPAVGRPGHAVPGRGLLGDRHHPGAPPVHGRVHLLEERHRVQVLPAAVRVRRPLAGLARVVEVEHRGDGVHPQPVDVELLAPVTGVGDQEVAHLAAAVVELQGAPVGVGGPQRVLVLVQGTAVELGQRPVVAREVRRHPVHEDADPGPVQGVDQVLEVVGGAEPGRGRVEAGDLVAPGAAEGMLGDRHQLDVGEAQVPYVVGQLLGQLAVRQPRAPGREMDLVHRERRLVHRRVRAFRQPLLVVPLVVRGVHDRGGARRNLGAAGQRVGAQGLGAVGAGDVELVQLALADAGHEQLPHAGAAQRPHRIRASVPEVEGAGHPHAPRVRRPHGEPGAGDALVGHRLGAERRPQLLVPALAEQVQVEVAQRGQETVRVLDVLDRPVVRHEQPVRRDLRQRQQAGEEPVPVVVQFGPQVPGGDRDGPCVRPEGTEGDPAGHRVGAEHAVRVVVGAGEQASAVDGVHGGGDGHGCLRRRSGRGGRCGCLLVGDLVRGDLVRRDGTRRDGTRRDRARRELVRRDLARSDLVRCDLACDGLVRGGLLRAGLLLAGLLRGGLLLRIRTAGRGAGGHRWSLLGVT